MKNIKKQIRNRATGNLRRKNKMNNNIAFILLDQVRVDMLGTMDIK